MAVPNEFIQYLQGLSAQEKKDAYREIFSVLGPSVTVTDENLRMAYKEYGDETRHFSTVRSALTTFLVTVMLGALSVFFNKSQSLPFLVAAAIILGLAAVALCILFSWRTSKAYLRRKRIWDPFAKGELVDRLEEKDFPSGVLILRTMWDDRTNLFLVVGLLLIGGAFGLRNQLASFHLPQLLDPPPASTSY
jgi:Na+/melibiose symporter-like transporter